MMTNAALKTLLQKKYPAKDGYTQGYSGWKKKDFVDALMGKKAVPKKKQPQGKKQGSPKPNTKQMTKVQLSRAIEKKLGFKAGTINPQLYLKQELIDILEGKGIIKQRKRQLRK